MERRCFPRPSGQPRRQRSESSAATRISAPSGDPGPKRIEPPAGTAEQQQPTVPSSPLRESADANASHPGDFGTSRDDANGARTSRNRFDDLGIGEQLQRRPRAASAKEQLDPARLETCVGLSKKTQQERVAHRASLARQNDLNELAVQRSYHLAAENLAQLVRADGADEPWRGNGHPLSSFIFFGHRDSRRAWLQIGGSSRDVRRRLDRQRSGE